MTPSSQGTRWFEFSEAPGWKARAVEAGNADAATRWLRDHGSASAGRLASNPEESSIDFVRQAIQRSYQ